MSHAARIRSLSGQEVKPSRWVHISQEAINLFADATQDEQWIHTDPERAKRDSPFGATVAHGMFTASLAPRLALEVLELLEAPIIINYGLNKVRFPAAVPAGTDVRLLLKVGEVIDVTGGVRATLHATMEAEGIDRPVCVAEFLLQIGNG